MAHIILFEYNGGKTLTVNGQSISTDFIGKWTHMTAEVNFKTHTMDITLTADGVTDKNSAGETIQPEASGTNAGKYMLVEGNYTITVTADGYAEKVQELELTPALSSKDVKIIL